MPYIKEVIKSGRVFSDDGFKALKLKSRKAKQDRAGNDKVLCQVTLSAREKKDNFLEIINGEVVEKCEAFLVGKVWHEMHIYFPKCKFCDYYFESDNFHGIIEISGSERANPLKVIPKVVGDLKSRSTQVLNHYHSEFGRIFWENSYNHILFENGARDKNTFYFFWNNPA